MGKVQHLGSVQSKLFATRRTVGQCGIEAWLRTYLKDEGEICIIAIADGDDLFKRLLSNHNAIDKIMERHFKKNGYQDIQRIVICGVQQRHWLGSVLARSKTDRDV